MMETVKVGIKTQKVLVFGDTHMPTRTDSIPASFYEQIKQTQYNLALVTGDLVREQAMRAALPPLPKCYIVKGNMDYGHDYRFHEQLQIEGLNVLLLHGTQLRPRGGIKQFHEILCRVGADIGIHGHTHKPTIDLYEGKLMINPGTISGATGGWRGRDDASFVELEISSSDVRVILYNTDWHLVKKSELLFHKRNGDMFRSE